MMVNIDELIPHRPPIRVLSDGQTVSAMMLIEAMAQTAALVEGFNNKLKGRPGVKGWLVGIKSARFYRERVAVGADLTVEVKSIATFDDYAVIEGEVRDRDDLIAEAVLQAVKFEGDNPKNQK